MEASKRGSCCSRYIGRSDRGMQGRRLQRSRTDGLLLVLCISPWGRLYQPRTRTEAWTDPP
jgi:hypothetical protein